MDHVTDLFDDATQTDPVSDLDVDIAHAGHVLTKLAEEAGIDLDKLSDADVAELVSDLLPEPKTSADKTTEEPETTRKEAHTMADADKTTPETTLTHADVGVELAKIASANGVDLATVSREEYTAAFEALAEKMSSPSYEQDKVAAQEMYKASYDQGVAMAEGFIDRLKQAEHDEHEDKDKKKEPPKKDGEHEEHKEAAAGFMSHLKETAKKHMGKAHEAAGAAKHKATEGGKKLMEHLKGHKREYAAGAAGAGAGAAAGAAGMAHHKKHSLDETALAVAQQVLRDNGIDPETGNKLAAEEPAPEFTEDDVAQRAAEMLKEAGYQLPE